MILLFDGRVVFVALHRKQPDGPLKRWFILVDLEAGVENSAQRLGLHLLVFDIIGHSLLGRRSAGGEGVDTNRGLCRVVQPTRCGINELSVVAG